MANKLSPEQWDVLIELCKIRVGVEGIADVGSVSNDFKDTFGIEEQIEFHEARKIANMLVAKDSRYDFHKDARESVCFVTRNKNYELEESVKTANESVKTTNTVTRRLAWVTAALAAFSAIASIATVLKANEKLSPSLQQLNTTLQGQEYRQQRIESSLREINRSIQIMTDSLPKSK